DGRRETTDAPFDGQEKGDETSPHWPAGNQDLGRVDRPARARCSVSGHVRLDCSLRSRSMKSFHPVVAGWFRERIGEPTTAQRPGWKAVEGRAPPLIAAPTGSGKTLAAFLSRVDDLFREGLEGPLPDEVWVIYVSPLRALSADIHKNLAEPRREIRARAEAA